MALPNLINESNNLSQLTILYQIQNILNAGVIGNMLLVGQSANAIVQTFYNANLYEVAVQYYGDYTLWTVIAQANNLIDPEVPGAITLLIPPKPTNNTDGGVLMTFPQSILLPLVT